MAVTDREMLEAMDEIGTLEGVFACPEGSATLVGLKRLMEQGFFSEDESIVLMNTGSGLKYLGSM